MKIRDDYPLMEVIPKNVTNGDILKTMFPNDLWLHIYARRAKKEWWNTPYTNREKKGTS